MKKFRSTVIVLLILFLLLLAAFLGGWWWYGTEEIANGAGSAEPDKPFIECESKINLHSYYEEEGFGTNDCGDYGQIEITEWNEDDATGTAVDWNGRAVEFY